MAKLKKYDLRAYVGPADYRRLEKESINRGQSLSKTVRDCLLEYLHLREELATAVQIPGEPGNEHAGQIIHTLLARTEERLAATFRRQEEQIAELQQQLLVITAMLDRLYLGMMQHLPEVPDKLTEAATASAKRRHGKWLKSVEKLLQNEWA